MINAEYYLEELSYLESTALWTKIMAFATIASALFFLITAIFAIVTYLKSKDRDRINITYRLFEEFTKAHMDTFESLSNNESSIQINDENNKKSYRLILFLSKLGNFLQEKRLSYKDIRIFFSSYLFYRDSILILIDNLKKFNPILFKPVRDSFNYLFKTIGQNENIQEFKNLIFDEFEELEKNEFKKILGGNLNFSGSLSIKKISVNEDYIKLSNELRKQLEGRYDSVENVKKEEYVELIFDKYFLEMDKLEISSKVAILNIIKNSLKEKEKHGKISEWVQLCKGIFKILEKEITPEKDKLIIVDIIVRISRWHRTVGNIWKGFVPYISEIVKIIWGDIENLHNKYSKDT